jgi:L-alanine-DL-glutamate epimerase-like enolase superfamily enzyme
MKIAAITISHHRLPLDPPFPAAWDSRPRTSFLATIVRVTTDEGLVGIGSGDQMLGFEGHEHLFVGHDPLALERHARVVDNLSFHYGRCWPLDVALWDLAGKILNQPVWRMLGGLSDRVAAYASSAVLRGPDAMAETAEWYLAHGFRAMKVRFHRPHWKDDVATVASIRKRVGDRLTLMVDCNQGWRMPWDTADAWTLKDALALARRLEELDVHWMEEPLHRGDLDGMRHLRGATRVRVAGGEMAREMHDLSALIKGGCLDVVQPDATLIGGITGLRRTIAEARAAGVAFTPHTWGNGIGVAANLHLTAGAANAPFIEFPFDPPLWSLERRDFPLIAPIAADKGGDIVLGEAPGLGLALDEERLAKTRIG